MVTYRIKILPLREAFLTTSAAAAILVCGGAAWAQDASPPPAPSSGASPSTGQAESAISEVVVTGTNIKGVKPIDPVITITRQDIDESGYATTGDVMRSLPEDFTDGQNPGVTTSAGGANQNITNGSSVDLFGLGTDATLTLINGHRLPSDGFYQGADISVIPLDAIKRVEVVTDGSSAIYGSDAVAGVVNFILRKDYNGLETSAYYGGATDGGDGTQIYSVLGGAVTERWHVLVSAEYEHENPITASARDYTSGAYGPDTLNPPQTRRTVFFSGGINITDSITFSLDGLYNDREAGLVEGYDGLVYHTNEKSPNVNVAATLEFKLPQGWDLSLVGSEAASSTAELQQELYDGILTPTALTYRNSVSSVEFTATGKAVTLPMGDLRMAVGGGYREEGYKADYPGEPAEDGAVVRASRGVAYVYGEALLPLVPTSVDRLGLQELELSVSGRYEHYSDFGETANPKVGLRYAPFGGLIIRGSWGTSFEAPSFTQEYQPIEVVYNASTAFGGKGDALILHDGNPNLKPETSTSWTIGADYSPPNLKSIVFSMTYFKIEYTNRIVVPVNAVNQSTFVTNPATMPFVTVAPSATVDQSTIEGAPFFLDAIGKAYNPSTVNYIIDDNFQNAEAQVDTGIDVSYRESFTLGIGEIRTFANATWNHLTQQLSPGEAFQTLSGTIFNVPNFKARTGATWSKCGFTATAIVNYTSSEMDTLVKPNTAIASWTTVDANLAYKFPDNAGIRHGLALTLSATNLFDKGPPYVKEPDSEFPGVDYDSLNASPIGRFIALKVTKKW